MVLEYRKATETEYADMVRLDQAAFNRDFDFALRNVDEVRQFLGDCENYLVTCDGKLAGYYSTKIYDAQTAEIVGIVVIPEYQRRGIGSAILGRILGQLRNVGHVKVVTHPKNIAALRLYSNFGFEIVDYSRDYYGAGQPRLVFDRLL
jgi:ribosomal protein S18 acetylase RimI-like enzyme